MNSRIIFLVCTMPILVMGNLWPHILKFYKHSGVTELSHLNFNRLVLESTDNWLVQFYTDWCSASKKVLPRYKQLATSLKDGGSDIHVGAMDVWYEGTFYDQLQIKSFPTFKFYGRDKLAPITYAFNHTDYVTVDSLQMFLKDQLTNEPPEKWILKDDSSEVSSSVAQDEIETTESWASSENQSSSEGSTQDESETTVVWATSENPISSEESTVDESETSEVWATSENSILDEQSAQRERETTEIWVTVSSEQKLGVNSGVSDKELSILLVLLASLIFGILFTKT